MKVKTTGSIKEVSYTVIQKQQVRSGANEPWRPGATDISVRKCAKGKWEEIQYTTSPKPYRTTNYCLHRAVTVDPVTLNSGWINWNTTNERWVMDFPDQIYSVASVMERPFCPPLANEHNAALDFFKAGCVDQELHLGVFLRELPELKRTGTLLRNLLHNKGKLPSQGSTFLTVEFGVKPVLNDLEAFAKSVMGLWDHIKWLRKNSGKPVRVNYERELSDLGPKRTFPAASGNSTYERISYSCRYKAFAVMKYDVSRLNSYELSLRTLVRQMGLDNPLGFAWERLPFSFVVDWVFSVQKVLDAVAPKIRIPYEIVDYGWSVKITEDREFWYSCFPNLNGSNAYMKRGHVRKKYYLREPGIPYSLGSVDIVDTTLDPKKLALALALIQSRLK